MPHCAETEMKLCHTQQSSLCREWSFPPPEDIQLLDHTCQLCALPSTSGFLHALHLRAPFLTVPQAWLQTRRTLPLGQLVQESPELKVFMGCIAK